MRKVSIVSLSIVLTVLFAISFTNGSLAADAKKAEKQTVKGNVICLLPDYDTGNVTPVVAQGPCDGYPPHAHVVVSEDGKIYALQGLQDGLQRIESLPKKRNVEIAGRVEGNDRGWVLFVE